MTDLLFYPAAGAIVCVGLWLAKLLVEWVLNDTDDGDYVDDYE